MRIGIVGAGAIGGFLGVALAGRGHALSVLARGQTLSVLRDRGWIVEKGDERFQARVVASDNAEEFGAQDALVIAVKGPALAEAARAACPMIGSETIVIPAMNGVPWWFLIPGGGPLPSTALNSVDPDGLIARTIPIESVLGCVVHASAQVTAPGEVTHQGGNK